MEAEIIAGVAAAHFVLSKLSAKPLEEIGQVLVDRVKTWRFRNQVAILEEAQAYSKKRGLQIKPVQLKTLLPLLEGASLEEDPTIRELWARLLVNAGNTVAAQHTANIAIEMLRALSPDDAKFLSVLRDAISTKHAYEKMREKHPYESVQKYRSRNVSFDPYLKIIRGVIVADTGFSVERFEICFDNISRFNVVEYFPPPRHDDFSQVDVVRSPTYSFTRLGWGVMNLICDGEPKLGD